MKPEKAAKAPHVLLVSKRFNEVRVSIFIGKNEHEKYLKSLSNFL